MGILEILLAYLGIALMTSLSLSVLWSIIDPHDTDNDELSAFGGFLWPFTITITLCVMSFRIVRSLNGHVRKIASHLQKKWSK